MHSLVILTAMTATSGLFGGGGCRGGSCGSPMMMRGHHAYAATSCAGGACAAPVVAHQAYAAPAPQAPAPAKAAPAMEAPPAPTAPAPQTRVAPVVPTTTQVQYSYPRPFLRRFAFR